NCDGFISQQDLFLGLEESGLGMLPEERKLQLFDELDEHGRGLVTLREFSKCLYRAAAAGRALSPRGDLSPRGPGRPLSPVARTWIPPTAPLLRIRQTSSLVAAPSLRRRSLSPPVPTQRVGGAFRCSTAPSLSRSSLSEQKLLARSS
ncbi:unnamed protein product, partial [Polarella glacialis]